MKPLYIQVHPGDNVAIIVNPEGLPAGTRFDSGLTLAETIPQSQKVALGELDEGAPVVRYGQVIGLANRRIPAGCWVRNELVALPAAPPLDELPLATAVPPPPEPLEGYSFEGYPNADGTIGTRNLLGISTTVQCVAPTLDYAVRRIREEILPRYPNVDGVVAVTHSYGCGVAIDAPGAEIPIRTIRNLGLHPNFAGAPMVIGLGCEKLQPERLFPGVKLREVGSTALPVLETEPYLVRLQNEELRGFGDMVAAILRAAEKRLEELNRRRRRSVPAAGLVVGLQCGGSDAFSGVTANPAVGYAADLLVRAGATVMFSEVTEVRDAIHLLTPRAINAEVGRALVREMVWYDEYLRRGSTDRSANPYTRQQARRPLEHRRKSARLDRQVGQHSDPGVLGPGERVATKAVWFLPPRPPAILSAARRNSLPR